MLDNIHWLGHSSFKINNRAGKTIYIDPWKIKDGSQKADLILITHDHYDHFSPEDIEKIKQDNTEIILPKYMAEKLTGRVKGVKPGDHLIIQEMNIEMMPAYNTDKEFHPRDNQWVGYIIEVDGQRIYHAGDTDLIPEMSDIKAEVALLPVSGIYTMTADEAARAVAIIKPKFAIPMHYGDIVGDQADADEFARLAGDAVLIMTRE